MYYTYDSLSRVTARTVKKLSDNSVVSTETFNYDAAGNITDAPESCFQYDTNNRLVVFNGNTISYDLDGNMLSNGTLTCTYDSANRLIAAGGHTYTYNVEDVRIRNLCTDEDTTYTYNTNCKLSQLLTKTTNGITTKYVYGLGLIGEESTNSFKTYHFDFRGSTVAITDINGNVTDTLKYDTYGKMTVHIGNSFIIFGYNGRDGVITDGNGLIYMRARYYSPEMRRFVNADILHGEISDSTSLNRYSYVNGNPVSFVDPFGLIKERGNTSKLVFLSLSPWGKPNSHVEDYSDGYLKERWYGSDGRAVKDRHHTDHGNSKYHTNPHDQEWDWSNPEYPTLKEPYTSKKEANEETKEQTSEESSFSLEPVVGVGIIIVAAAGFLWVVGNDVSVAGVGDDWTLIPIFETFKKGLEMVFA